MKKVDRRVLNVNAKGKVVISILQCAVIVYLYTAYYYHCYNILIYNE